MFTRLRYLIYISIAFLSFGHNLCYADLITLNIPILEEAEEQHHFFHELLEEALKDIGHEPEFIIHKLPQLRVKKYLSEGELSVYWMLESEERNRNYLPIKVGLTDGLIGKRVLFIKEGDQHLYDKVKNIDDFRNLNLIAAMGKDWFDVNVWKANNLRYKEEPGNWKSIFRKIPHGRPYNYFSRGINEILVESELYPELKIEKNLVLIYDRDFLFYLSKEGPNAGAKYELIIKEALNKAKESGLIDRLVDKYWSKNFQALDYDKRIKIQLQTPN